MRVEVDEFAPDIPGLFPVELVEITVWVIIRCQLALEVMDTINIVAWEDLDVHLLEKRRGPCFVGIHLADQSHHGLVCCRLIAVDGGLDVDSELGGVATCVRRRRQEKVWDLATFFRQEIGCSVSQPTAMFRDGSIEVV